VESGDLRRPVPADRSATDAGAVTEPHGVQRADSCWIRRDGAVLRISGEIDQANWAVVADNIVGAVRTGVVRVDLTEVGFCGAAGVRALLRGRAAVPAGSVLILTCPPVVFRILEVCGLVGADRLIVTAAGAGDQPPEATG
jgi:anti-anti-sigma factor